MARDQLAGCPDARVAAAMAALPRHAFVPAAARTAAYDDAPLAIGAGQTISQPRLVARMLALLRLEPGQQVLDVGAGSGYAAALIARLVAPGGSVLALERQAALLPAARRALAAYAPLVELRLGDALALAAGSFDAIHCACACREPPRAWLPLLAPGGRLLAPVGPPDGEQQLCLLGADGACAWLDPVLFVPALPGLARAAGITG